MLNKYIFNNWIFLININVSKQKLGIAEKNRLDYNNKTNVVLESLYNTFKIYI